MCYHSVPSSRKLLTHYFNKVANSVSRLPGPEAIPMTFLLGHVVWCSPIISLVPLSLESFWYSHKLHKNPLLKQQMLPDFLAVLNLKALWKKKRKYKRMEYVKAIDSEFKPYPEIKRILTEPAEQTSQYMKNLCLRFLLKQPGASGSIWFYLEHWLDWYPVVLIQIVWGVCTRNRWAIPPFPNTPLYSCVHPCGSFTPNMKQRIKLLLRSLCHCYSCCNDVFGHRLTTAKKQEAFTSGNP